MSSIAASSALVSETILDTPSTNFLPRRPSTASTAMERSFSCPDTNYVNGIRRSNKMNGGNYKSKSTSTIETDKKGVSHHTFTPGRITEILSKVQSNSDYYCHSSDDCHHQRYDNNNNNNNNNNDIYDSSTKTLVHPSHYHAYLNEQRKLNKARQNSLLGGEEDDTYDPPPRVPCYERDDAPDESLGILASTRKWLEEQRVRRQMEALKHAVEEQRRVLSRENLRAQMKDRGRFLSKRHTFDTHEGLGSNPTFQSITGGGRNYSMSDITYDDHDSKSNSIVSLSFCGGNQQVEDDDDYIVQNSLSYSTAEVNCTFSNEQQLTGPSDETYDESIDNSRQQQSRDEEIIRIGSPHKTFSGQGVSVQLEIIDRIRADLITTVEDEERFTIQDEKNDIPHILTYKQLLAIAKRGLPASVLFTRWTRLYSLLRDGDSFEGSFLRKVRNHTRTLLIVTTTRHEVMAAYSNSAWESRRAGGSASFYGSAQACLFRVDGEEVEVFKWSGENRYIQVCDAHSKMLAFGGGGKDGEFGLCVENDFSTGSTGACDTFRNRPLCSEDRFEVLNVECWGFMPVFS